jgi:hypothetical protein
VETDHINGAGYLSKKISGRDLDRGSSHASIMTKLCIVPAIASGEAELTDPTIAQMLGLKGKQVRAVMRLSPEERAALTSKRRVNNVARFSNDVVDDIVDKVGAART